MFTLLSACLMACAGASFESPAATRAPVPVPERASSASPHPAQDGAAAWPAAIPEHARHDADYPRFTLHAHRGNTPALPGAVPVARPTQ